MLAVTVHDPAAQRQIPPVTDAMLQAPPPEDWLMWRRTLDSWGYSPLDQINRSNVRNLALVWSRGLTAGIQEGTPLVHDGVMFMPNPLDVVHAIDAATGDLLWEYRRSLPADMIMTSLSPMGWSPPASSSISSAPASAPARS